MGEVLAIGLIGLALALGVKHSFDADHIVAVSTYLTRAKRVKSALKLGIHWAIGHAATAAVITYAIFSFKDIFLVNYLSSFESLVAIMLIALGILAFKDIKKIHSHAHKHGEVEHAHPHMHSKADHQHKHMLGIGIVHGLASNDELLILLTAEIGLTSLFGMFVGVLAFSAGVVAGMAAFSFLVNYPIVKWGNRIRTGLVGGSGILSILYGLVLLAGL